MISVELGVWIAALLTIFIITMLYKDNPFYRIGEAIYIGTAAGHALVMGLSNAYKKAFTAGIFAGDLLWVIPVILGAIYLMRLLPKEYGWPARYPIAVLGGLGLGLAAKAVLKTQVIEPLVSTFIKVNLNDPLSIVNSVLVMVFCFSTIYYFIYTIKGVHEGAGNYVQRIGRLAMMILFGQTIGSNVMTFSTRFIARCAFLLSDWLGLV